VKWCNPPKEHRAAWATVPPPGRDYIKEAHKWCIEQEGTSCFYHHYTNTRWWFESREDAVMFALMFTGKGNDNV